MKYTNIRTSVFKLGLLGCGALLATAAYADPAPTPAPVATNTTYETNQNFFDSWFAMASATQAEQPHWMTPLVTVTPRLEQEVRADFDFARLPGNKGTLDNYGAGKGIEIIPAPNVELIFGVPPYESKQPENGKATVSGWGDWPMFLAKYRIISHNEQTGDEVLTAFFQVQKPTGSEAYTEGTYILQPTIAGGKGWGPFDVQATLSAQFPDGNKAATHDYGNRVLTNVAFQYQHGILWPELEFNDTWFASGGKEGKNQLFITPGVILGRFQIHGRVKLVFGVGYQVAVTPALPNYRNNVVLTTRMSF